MLPTVEICNLIFYLKTKIMEDSTNTEIGFPLIVSSKHPCFVRVVLIFV